MNNQTIIVLCVGGILFSVQALSAGYLSAVQDYMYGRHTHYVYKIRAENYSRFAKLHTFLTSLCFLAIIVGVSC